MFMTLLTVVGWAAAIIFIGIPLYLVIGITIIAFMQCLLVLSEDGVITLKKMIEVWKDIPDELENMTFIWPLFALAGAIYVPYKIFLDKPLREWYSNNKNKPLIMTKSGRTKHVLFGDEKEN